MRSGLGRLQRSFVPSSPPDEVARVARFFGLAVLVWLVPGCHPGTVGSRLCLSLHLTPWNPNPGAGPFPSLHLC